MSTHSWKWHACEKENILVAGVSWETSAYHVHVSVCVRCCLRIHTNPALFLTLPLCLFLSLSPFLFFPESLSLSHSVPLSRSRTLPLLHLCGAAEAQQARVMTRLGGWPKRGWRMLCPRPVASCHHHRPIWAERLLSTGSSPAIHHLRPRAQQASPGTTLSQIHQDLLWVTQRDE